MANYEEIDTIDEIKRRLKQLPSYNFSKIKIKAKINFREFIIGNEVLHQILFNECEFDEEVDLSKLEFKTQVIFQSCIFYKNVTFASSTFNTIFKLDNSIFFEEVNFNNAKIYRGGTFNKVIFYSNVNFISTKFKLNDGVRHSESDFSMTVFGDNNGSFINFKDCDFDMANFKNSQFNCNISFDSSTFHGKGIFNESLYYISPSFCNTTFKNLADFYGVTFYQPQQFYKTDFEGTTVFSGATFKENVMFVYTLFSGMLILRNTTFEKGLDLSLANISCEMNFFDIKIKNQRFKAVPNPKNKLEFEKLITNATSISLKGKRETYRIIKNSLNKNENIIDALKYKEFELTTKLLEEINNIIHYKFSFSDFYNSIKSFTNLILLFIYFISNVFGGSWIVGLLFTTTMMLFSFYLAMESINFTEFDLSPNSVSIFFQFINPTHKISDLNINQSLTSGFYGYDFLGRILISFGIYQFIQAFRKFGRK